MENPNLMALDLVDEAIDFADELNVGVRHLENDATVLDFGVDARGGVEAGLLLAEVATGGLATVQTRLGTVDGAALTHVEVSTDHPTASLLACQAPAWPLDVGGAAVRGCGPAQLSREVVRDAGIGAVDLGFDDSDFAVLVVDSPRLPDEAVAETVAAESDVPTSGVFVLVAPASSVAGSVAFAARAGERTLARLATLDHDPAGVRTVAGAAPVAPLAREGSAARVRSAAAVAYGGRIHLVVEGDVDRPERLVYGDAGGEEVDEGAEPLGGDAEPSDRLDDVLAPAQVTVDVVGGPTHVVGGVDETRLAERLDL